MRHTLLPPEERKALRRDYSLRLAIVFFFLLSVASLVGAVSLFPAYINVRNMEMEEGVVAAELRASKEVQNRSIIESRLRTDSIMIERLLSESGNSKPSKDIRFIAAERGVVRFTTIFYSMVGTSTIVLVVQGIAPNRNDLIALKNKIAMSLPVAKIELPLSELAKSKNVTFSMKVSYPKK